MWSGLDEVAEGLEARVYGPTGGPATTGVVDRVDDGCDEPGHDLDRVVRQDEQLSQEGQRLEHLSAGDQVGSVSASVESHDSSKPRDPVSSYGVSKILYSLTGG